MSEIQEGSQPKKPGKTQVIVSIAVVAAVLAVLYAGLAIFFKPQRDLNSLAEGHMAKLAFADRPATAAVITFRDAAGKVHTPRDFKGQVLVVNLWATWCGPCKVEMPTLAKLQASYAGKPVKVVALSTDRDDAMPEAKAFIAANGPLQYYGGGEKLPFMIEPHVMGFPTTIIFDKAGHERARMSGDADWSTPEAHKVIDRLLAGAG
jgi:thiol-disulfide isomerase/thioredoxin